MASAIVHWKYTLLVVLLGLGGFAAIQNYYNANDNKTAVCKDDNTFTIFTSAYRHLLDGQNLYLDYPNEHCYTYKYSPAFALFFGIFAYLPEFWGLLLWSLLTAIVTFTALRQLPGTAPPQQFLFLAFISFECLLSMQAQQTNALLAALLLLALAFLEKGKYLPATLFIVLTGFIKIFGLGAMLLYLFYPQKWKLGLYTLAWGIVLAIIPLVVVSPSELWGIYGDWYAQIVGDHAKYSGMSFYGMLGKLTGTEPPKNLFLGISLLLMGITALQYKKWNALWFRQLTLAALLIWMVIFNHKAESPSYGIAMVGMALWFFSARRKGADIVLLLFAFIGVSLLFSDFTPKWIRKEYMYPFQLKALPCLVVWCRVLVEMWWRKAVTGTPEAAPAASELARS